MFLENFSSKQQQQGVEWPKHEIPTFSLLLLEKNPFLENAERQQRVI